MISNLVSFFISSRLQHQPIYEVLAYQEGVHLPTAESRIAAGQRQVIHAMRPADEALKAEMTTQEALERESGCALRAWPVSDQRGVVSIVTLDALQTAVADVLSNTKL